MNRDQMIHKLKFYIRKYYRRPNHYYGMTDEEFYQKAYSYWAVNEILNGIYRNPSKPIIEIVEDFRDCMDEYSCKGKSSTNNIRFSCGLIFAIAYDTASDILDFVISLR